MMAKDFNEDEHMTCPVCGFEIVYLKGDESYYLFKDGSIDYETENFEEDYSVETIQCNHIHCDWELD